MSSSNTEQLENNREASSSQPKATMKYAISTSIGAIPYVIECDHPEFRRPKIVFLDDFLFKDSIYDKNQKVSLVDLIGGAETAGEIGLAFRNATACKNNRILTSKRGNYKLTPERYSEILALMGVETHAEFKTGVLRMNGGEVVEPTALSEYVRGTETVFGTQIVNDLTAKGMLIYLDGDKLSCKHLNETDHEYEKYMLSINEMNAFTFIAEHNYKALYEFSGQ